MFADRYKFVMGLGPFNCDGAASTIPIGASKGTIVVDAVEIYNSASLATHATQYITLKLVNLGTAGTGTTVVASASTSQTGGSAITANKVWPLTVTSANATFTDEQVLGFVRNEAHTDAGALAACVVKVYYTQVAAD